MYQCITFSWRHLLEHIGAYIGLVSSILNVLIPVQFVFKWKATLYGKDNKTVQVSEVHGLRFSGENTYFPFIPLNS